MNFWEQEILNYDNRLQIRTCSRPLLRAATVCEGYTERATAPLSYFNPQTEPDVTPDAIETCQNKVISQREYRATNNCSLRGTTPNPLHHCRRCHRYHRCHRPCVIPWGCWGLDWDCLKPHRRHHSWYHCLPATSRRSICGAPLV